MSGSGSADNEILLKRSGKRARLEITEADLEETARLPAVTTAHQRPARAPARGRGVTSPAVDLKRPRPLPGRGGPPAGGPPTRYVHDAPTPWWKTRAATWTAAGLLALLVVVVVAAIALIGGTDPAEATYDQLSKTSSAVIDVTDEASQATRLVAVRAAGADAATGLDELQSPEAALRQISDERYRQPAVDLVVAERAYLEALQQLRRVNVRMVDGTKAADWAAIRRRIANKQREVVRASDAVAALDFSEDAAKVTFTPAEMNATLVALGTTVSKARQQMREYRARLRNWRRAVARARGKAAVITRYRDAVQSSLNDYRTDRTKVDDFVAKAGQLSLGDSIARAQTEVDGFYADRQDTIAQLSNALTDAPESVRTAHKNLESPLQQSLRGLDALRQAISEYETDPYGSTYTSVTETPAWGEFQDASRSATSDYDSAVAQWNSAVQAAVKQVKDRGGIPPEPKRPQV